MKDDREKRIFLDYPIDILFNRECCLTDYDHGIRDVPPELITSHKKKKKNGYEFTGKRGGLVLPGINHLGTGNILILGRPGTGKSLLALQIAIASTVSPNPPYSALFFSLEEQPQDVSARCTEVGWGDNVRSVRFMDRLTEFSTPEEIGKALAHLMTQPKWCLANEGTASGEYETSVCDEHVATKNPNVKCTVLLPSLSPRSVGSNDARNNALFWEHLRQIEIFLIGAKRLRETGKKNGKPTLPEIRIVCVDSLTAFGDAPLSREEYHQIFELFKRYGVLGVFTAEETAERRGDEAGSAIEYLADVVIRLKAEEDNGYALRYFEIEKSRYQHQVYGRHPLRLQPRPKKPTTTGNYFQAVQVFPSLHHVVAATSGQAASESQTLFEIGINGFNKVLRPDLMRGSVVTIKGPQGTFKTPLARNFLLFGLCANGFQDSEKRIKKPESVLLLRMNDDTSFNPTKVCQVSHGVVFDDDDKDWTPFTKPEDISKKSAQGEMPSFKEFELKRMCTPKLMKKVWKYGGKADASAPHFIEVALKGGALLPEEFLETVRVILNEYARQIDGTPPIRRVVLDDVGHIGASYPFLRRSSTAGNMFLSAFVHVMRNYGVDLVITGTTGQLKESDEVVDLACELADSVLRCDFIDVFGDRYVIVRGEGQTASLSEANAPGAAEFVPGAIVKMDKYRFKVDFKLLQGLVGFDTGLIHRPGLTLQLFNEGTIHEQYNKEIEMMMSSAFSAPRARATGEKHKEAGSPPQDGAGARNYAPAEDRRRVSLIRFDSEMSEAVHDSLGVLEGKPLDRTMVCSFDDFYMSLAAPGNDQEPGAEQKAKRLIDMTNHIGDKINRFYLSVSAKGILGVPYYANVLLIAYRTGSISVDKGKKGRLTWAEWKEKIYPKKKPKDGKELKFDFDLSAKETLTCSFLDAIISAFLRKNSNIKAEWEKHVSNEFNVDQATLCDNDRKKGQKVSEWLRKVSTQSAEGEEIVTQLTAFQELFSNSRKGRALLTDEKSDKDYYLDEDADLYVCWYSQLRELIHQHPKLADQLDVAPLPGGGFRGDWFLGIVKGSVSETLGQNVIDLLCDPQEEYKRFVRGVGLPVTKRFFCREDANGNSYQEPTGFLAWPSARLPLSKILLIHRGALTRSRITGYHKYRAALYVLSEMIASGSSKGENAIKNCIDRLNYIFKILDDT